MFAETFEARMFTLGLWRVPVSSAASFIRAERQLQRGFIGAFAQTATAFSGALAWRYGRDFPWICRFSANFVAGIQLYALWKRFHSRQNMQSS
jgi:hypothetical protein